MLAAGAGRRFGGPKALATLDGETLVDRAARTLRAGGCDPVVVVLGAAAEDVVRVADLGGAVVLVNDGWPEGMGSSLRCGLRALADLQAPAAVVLVVDQPGITAEAVRRLVAAWRDGARSAVATFGGQLRNPALLDASTWADVSATAVGDTGARTWLRAHADRLRLVACDDVASDRDIDTPADLVRLSEDMT